MLKDTIIDKEKYIQAFSMRLDGCTLDEIGKKLGCSRQTVHLMLKKVSCVKEHKKTVYPGLNKWLYENASNVTELSREIGCSQSTLSIHLNGIRDLKISTIFKILEYTGLSFEEAFGGTNDGTA